MDSAALLEAVGCGCSILNTGAACIQSGPTLFRGGLSKGNSLPNAPVAPEIANNKAVSVARSMVAGRASQGFTASGVLPSLRAKVAYDIPLVLNSSKARL